MSLNNCKAGLDANFLLILDFLSPNFMELWQIFAGIEVTEEVDVARRKADSLG